MLSSYIHNCNISQIRGCFSKLRPKSIQYITIYLWRQVYWPNNQHYTHRLRTDRATTIRRTDYNATDWFHGEQKVLWEREPPTRLVWGSWNNLARHEIIYPMVSCVMSDICWKFDENPFSIFFRDLVYCVIPDLSWKFHKNPSYLFPVMLIQKLPNVNCCMSMHIREKGT